MVSYINSNDDEHDSRLILAVVLAHELVVDVVRTLSDLGSEHARRAEDDRSVKRSLSCRKADVLLELRVGGRSRGERGARARDDLALRKLGLCLLDEAALLQSTSAHALVLKVADGVGAVARLKTTATGFKL